MTSIFDRPILMKRHPFASILAALAGLLLLLLVAACDPMAPYPQPTPQVIIITSEASPTPAPTTTPAPTRTPLPTPTPPATPTATAFPCAEDGGQVLEFNSFRSEVAEEVLRYRVYVPPCYGETQKRYPYAILLHGANENERQWEALGLPATLDQGIRLGALPPMLVVMPYMGAVGNRNIFPPDPSYETVMLQELVPAVERNFCTWSDRAHRAIGGISRGGFWAYSIALRHPDVFSIVGGHSAFFDSDIAPPAHDPLELALNAQFISEANLRMYLDNGAEDPAGTTLQLFSSRLSSRGIAHTYIIHPVGKHSDEYWQAHLAEYLAFYGQSWPKTTSELPSCAEPSP
jgi:enterochelin esterase-like enzyme